MFYARSSGCVLFYLLTKDMDKNKTAVFIGHGDCPLSVEDIKPFIEQEIRNGVEVFLSGGQGRFDINAAYAVHKLKPKYPHIRNILCVPYHNFRIFDKEIFDEIINPVFSNSESYTGYKTAIPKRNRYMLQNASTAICYITHISGGAYNTFKLAKKKKLAIINISKEIEKQNYERSDIMQTKLIAVTADLLTLSYLSRQPGSAYEITKFIEENSTEGTALSQNAVYTSLYKLAQNGYVKSETATTETGRIREVYSILPEGIAYYQSFLVSYVKQIESVNHLLNIVK